MTKKYFKSLFLFAETFLPSVVYHSWENITKLEHLSSIYWCMRPHPSWLPANARSLERLYSSLCSQSMYQNEMKRAVESFNRKLTERQLLDNSRETQRSWTHNNLCRFHCAFLLTVRRPERIICRGTERTIRNWLIGSPWFLVF